MNTTLYLTDAARPTKEPPTKEPLTKEPGRDRQRVVASLEHVSKTYGDTDALSGVSLEVRAGETLAILGPNGAGKTTAVSLLLGLLKPTKGRATLFGSEPQSLSRTRTGAMLQISGVPETLKVREHLALFSSYYPCPLSVTESLNLAGLEGLEDRAYGTLSGGQKQRVHFALALCGDPDLLFLDEPTAGLDAAARRAFWAQVRSLTGRGKAVVLTTHYLEEVDALAHRVVVLKGGQIIAEGAPADIRARAAGQRVRCTTQLSEERVRTLPGVEAVTRNGPTLELLVTAAEPAVRELLQRDPDLRHLEVTRTNLEDAFFALTEKGATTKSSASAQRQEVSA